MSNAFNMELRAQQEWSWLLAIWLFLGGTGSGLFLVFLAFGLPPFYGAVALALIVVGGVVLLLELGNPLRAWRGIFRAGTSWLSRGVLLRCPVRRLGFPFRRSEARDLFLAGAARQQPRCPAAGLVCRPLRRDDHPLSGLLLPLDLARDPVLEHAAAAAVFCRLRRFGRRGIGVAADALRECAVAGRDHWLSL